jgi:serine/threonine-protein kinase
MSRPALDRLGPYELIKNLTRPGRAEVYLGHQLAERDAESTATGRELPEYAVIKVLRPPEQVDSKAQGRIQEALARFVEEGRLGVRMRHPAIARTYGVGLDKRLNLHFIIQEFVEGITLAQLLDHCASREQRLQYGIALRLLIPILKALHYANHDALREDGRPLRVVHRDIKPANVMLAYDGRVMLLDLASAKSTSFTRQDTVQDVIMGTAHYLAPEQVFDVERVGHQTDIFAAGVILYELCSLVPLLPRTRRLAEVANALARFNFDEHADNIDENLYPGLKEVLRQALSPDPSQRYQTAGEMARDLDGLLLQAGDGPGLAVFAAEVRRQWAGELEGVEPERSDAGRPARSSSSSPSGVFRLTEVLSPGAPPQASQGAAAPNPPPSSAVQLATVVTPPRPVDEGGKRYSLSDLALAAILGVVVASATWWLLKVF